MHRLIIGSPALFASCREPLHQVVPGRTFSAHFLLDFFPQNPLKTLKTTISLTYFLNHWRKIPLARALPVKGMELESKPGNKEPDNWSRLETTATKNTAPVPPGVPCK